MKPATVKQLLAQEADREHCSFLKGIRLKVKGIVVGPGSQPYQPVDYRGQRANEQEDFPALGVAAAEVFAIGVEKEIGSDMLLGDDCLL